MKPRSDNPQRTECSVTDRHSPPDGQWQTAPIDFEALGQKIRSAFELPDEDLELPWPTEESSPQ